MINFNLLGIRIISTMDTETEDRHISTVYFSTDGKWQDGPELKKGDTVVLTVSKTWPDICWFYANIIDYFRCYLAIVALVVILYTPEQKVLIGCLIMGNLLLDWIDGPVARHYGQQSVMGCGWDWLADILA